MGFPRLLFHAEMDEGTERQVSPKKLKMFNKGVAIAHKSLKAAVAQLHNGEEHGLGVYRARTMETKNSGKGQQFQSQVHIRTSPDALPENVDVFVGSDSTNSVTAPCIKQKKRSYERRTALDGNLFCVLQNRLQSIAACRFWT